MDIQTTLRNAPLERLVDLLREQNDVRYDVVVPAGKLRYEHGNLHVVNGAVRFNDGDELSAVECDAVLQPTDVFEDGVSNRLGIPRQYLRTLRTSGVDVELPRAGWSPSVMASLLDANVNGWLQSDPQRLFLVRAFRTDDPDDIGVARSLLSNRFAVHMDNYDVLFAVLAGAKEAGLNASQLDVSANLTERNMRVHITAPEITALAPILLGNYRSPFAGRGGAHGQAMQDEGHGFALDAGGNLLPIVEAGLYVSNSETGGGAFQVGPRARVRACANGLTVVADGMRHVHIGGRLDEGVIRWSDDTERKNLELIMAKTRDAVASFLNADYVAHLVDEIEKKSGTPIDDTLATIERVSKKHAFTESEQASILDCFVKSGDVTAGGVMQAVTAAAQLLDDPDRAAEFEDMALAVLDTAAAAA